MGTRSLSRRRVISLGAGVVATGITATGCTWLDARSNSRVTVRVEDQYVLDPATIEVAPGTTVVWQNQSSARVGISTDPDQVSDPALIAVPEGHSGWDSGDLTTGMTWEYTFHEPGTWVYVVRPEDTRAIGVVTVSEQD